jgi:hypothetical protein
MRLCFFPVLLMPVVACSSSTDVKRELLHVETTADSYVVGDTIQVVATNIGDVTVHYGICAGQLERREGIRWVARYPVLPPGAACVSLPNLIDPGATQMSKIPLRADSPVGVFRLVVPHAPIDADVHTPRTRGSNLFFISATP